MSASEAESFNAQADSSAEAVIETLASFLGSQSTDFGPADLPRQPKVIQKLLDELPLGVFWKDRDARFLGANKMALDHFEVAIEQVVGRRYEEFLVNDQLSVSASDRKIMSTGVGMYDAEVLGSKSGGALSIIRVTKVPIFDDAKRVVGVMGFFSDVSEKAKALADLEVSEMRYSLAVSATRDGIWDLDMVHGEFYLSDRCRELLDLPGGLGPVSWLSVARKVGSDQLKLVVDRIRVAALDPRPDKPLPVEVGLESEDGSMRWLNVVGAPLSTDGKLARIVGTVEDVTADRLREDELIYKATHDQVTGLPNRQALTERLGEALDLEEDFALLNIDIDQFRLTNDSLGRETGNHILSALGDRVTECVGDSGYIVRSGGDEFGVLLDGDSNAPEIADYLLEILSQPIEVGDLELFVSTTIGVVQRDDGHIVAADVLRDVDNALYRAKQAGKGTYCLFKTHMRREAEAELELQTRIRRAVREQEFELLYQPLFSAAERKMVGVEALIRWRPDGPDGKLVPPDVFLPYLENSGLIVVVGRWVIEQACSQMAQWRRLDQRMEEVSISVNVSRVQFQGAQLSRYLSNALTQHSIPASDLSIEITETMVALSMDELIDQLLDIRGSGVRIALDDFGVGQSSLSILYKLPVDVVKIDRSFVDRIRLDENEPVTEAALEIARSMGLGTVAEGVETVDQATWLSSSGCNILQGFLLSRPVPASEVLGYLDN